MSVIEQAQQAYAPTHTAIRTDQSVEAQLITQITIRLRKAATLTKAEFPFLVSVLHDNQTMWTAMAADVADNGNGLPVELRAQLFYLAEFTTHHSQQVMRGKADVTALVDVNTAVLRGLNAQAAA